MRLARVACAAPSRRSATEDAIEEEREHASGCAWESFRSPPAADGDRTGTLPPFLSPLCHDVPSSSTTLLLALNFCNSCESMAPLVRVLLSMAEDCRLIENRGFSLAASLRSAMEEAIEDDLDMASEGA